MDHSHIHVYTTITMCGRFFQICSGSGPLVLSWDRTGGKKIIPVFIYGALGGSIAFIRL